MNTTIISKICTKCNEEKSISEFYTRNKSKDGFHNQCKECNSNVKKSWYLNNIERVSARGKAYHLENKDHRNSLMRDWYEKNKDSKKEYNKDYYIENIEQVTKKKKEWYINNRESCLSYLKSWREENPDKIKHYNATWYKENPEQHAAHVRNRRARERLASGTHTSKDIKNLFTLQRGKCAVCRVSIEKGYHVDHIVALVNGGSNDKYNLQLLCAHCNCTKRSKDPIEFMNENGRLI